MWTAPNPSSDGSLFSLIKVRHRTVKWELNCVGDWLLCYSCWWLEIRRKRQWNQCVVSSVRKTRRRNRHLQLLATLSRAPSRRSPSGHHRSDVARVCPRKARQHRCNFLDPEPRSWLEQWNQKVDWRQVNKLAITFHTVMANHRDMIPSALTMVGIVFIPSLSCLNKATGRLSVTFPCLRLTGPSSGGNGPSLSTYLTNESETSGFGFQIRSSGTLWAANHVSNCCDPPLLRWDGAEWKLVSSELLKRPCSYYYASLAPTFCNVMFQDAAFD